MSPEERQAIQVVLVETLSAESQRNPLLLVDTLLSGDGYALVYHTLTSQAAMARRRADMLDGLLRAMMTDQQARAQATAPAPTAPPPAPPVGASMPLGMVPRE